MATMKLTIATTAYNHRRYGKPYVARIDFSADPRGTAIWGVWVGTPGDAGVLVIDAEAGQCVMQGQKDFRGRNGTPEYSIVQSDGTLKSTTKADAYLLSLQATK